MSARQKLLPEHALSLAWVWGPVAAIGLGLSGVLLSQLPGLVGPLFARPAAEADAVPVPRGVRPFPAPDAGTAEAQALARLEEAAGRFGVRSRSVRPQPGGRPDVVRISADWSGREDRVYRALESLETGTPELAVLRLAWRTSTAGELSLSLEVGAVWRRGTAAPPAETPTEAQP
jgi:hypothetical protein